MNWKYWVIRKMKPNRPKKAAAIAPLAAEKRRSRTGCTSNSGSAAASPTRRTEQRQQRRRPGRDRRDATPAVGRRLDDGPDQQPDPDHRTECADRIEPARGRIAGFPDQRATATPAINTSGTLTRNTADQEKCSTSNPPLTGPSATDRPVMPDQIPMAAARSRRSGNSVDEQCEGGREDQRGAGAHGGPAGDQLTGDPAKDAATRRQTEQHESRQQHPATAEPIAQVTRRAVTTWRKPVCSRRPSTAGRWSRRPVRARWSVARR